jgi:hypothetical protein
MAFIAARKSILRGLPPSRAGGIIGSSRAHSVSRQIARTPVAGKSGAAPPATSLFAIIDEFFL